MAGVGYDVDVELELVRPRRADSDESGELLHTSTLVLPRRDRLGSGTVALIRRTICPFPLCQTLTDHAFLTGNFMLGVEFYSQANGEVLASVQQPVSYPLLSRQIPPLSVIDSGTAVSSRSPLRRSINPSAHLPRIHVACNIPPPRTIYLQPNVTAVQPPTPPTCIVYN